MAFTLDPTLQSYEGGFYTPGVGGNWWNTYDTKQSFFQPTGSVLGESTSNVPQYDEGNYNQQPSQPTGPSVEEQAAQEAARQAAAEQARRDKLTSGINSTYDALYAALDNMAGYLDPWKQTQQQGVGNLYQSQLDELDTAKQGALSKFPGYYQEVDKEQSKSIRDLAQNMRNLYQAGNVYLGSVGAGSSSAVPMYAAALAKQGSRLRSDYVSQANDQRQDLRGLQANIENTYQQQVGQLGTWKTQELSRIENEVAGKLYEIRQQKEMAPVQKQQALQAMEESLLNEAIQRLDNLNNQFTTWRQGLNQWAIERLASLDDSKLSISNSSNFDPRAVVQKEMQGISGLSAGGNSDFAYMPYLKKQQDAAYSAFGL